MCGSSPVVTVAIVRPLAKSITVAVLSFMLAMTKVP
jgi:hypothetical protein